MVRDDLVKAKGLIDTPEKWHRGGWGTGGQHCAAGALRKVTVHDIYSFTVSPAYLALMAALPAGYLSVVGYNDSPATTHADIMALFDRAISNAEAGE